MKINFDKFTTDQINEMIDSGQITDDEVADFYRKKWLAYISWPTRHIF